MIRHLVTPALHDIMWVIVLRAPLHQVLLLHVQPLPHKPGLCTSPFEHTIISTAGSATAAQYGPARKAPIHQVLPLQVHPLPHNTGLHRRPSGRHSSSTAGLTTTVQIGLECKGF